MSKKHAKRLPTICADEHISPAVIAAARRVLNVVEAGKHHKFRGHDEHDYVKHMYSDNLVFMTSDFEFVNDAYEHKIKHAGIIYIPNKMTEEEQVLFAEVAAQFVHGGCRDSAHAFRGCTLYPSVDGVSLVKPDGTNELMFSWTWLWEA